MSLFERQEKAERDRHKPLAARMRPASLSEFAGQQHFLGPGKLLQRMLAADRITSVIFYGPPGCGKTSLAELISRQTKSTFTRLNAAAAGVKELRAAVDDARTRLETSGRKTLLFVDELHRFNRSQQDVLLPDVEDGIIGFIGATTQNPFFALVAPLVSRSQIFEFKPLTSADILPLLRRALTDPNRGLGKSNVVADDAALDFLADISDGDARRALHALEIAVLSLPTGSRLTVAVAEESVQKKAIQYDRDGDQHYDVASALIKSIRGSDPDAAVYWLARMLSAGEEPRFIARRLVIAASEDVGNADPAALPLVQAAAAATEFIGMPECRIILAQAATYLAMAPKSNAAIVAIDSAIADVEQQRLLPVPMHLQDKHYAGAEQLGHGAGYQYPHNSPEGWIPQDYLGVDRQYYRPVDRGFEAELLRRVTELRARRAASHGDDTSASRAPIQTVAPGGSVPSTRTPPPSDYSG